MPLTYPLTLPSNGVRNITFRQRTRVGEARSPYTQKRQVYPWAAQWWEAEVTLPPMKRATAEAWISFLVGLNGREGTFLMGDPANRTPRDGGLAPALMTTTLKNGGFETAGAGGSDVFSDWSEVASGSSTITRDTSVFHSGAASVRFNIDSISSTCAVYQTLFTAGKRYRVTYRARGSVGGEKLKFLLGSTGLAYTYDQTLTNTWAEYTFEGVAGGGTFQINGSFDHLTAPNQVLWVDSITVIPLDTYGGLVNGGSQTGGDLQTDGWLASYTNIMSAGDWLQLGTGSSARLHKVLQGADSNASGEATLLIWPSLRTSPADNAAVIVENPVGLFALAENQVEWSIDEARIYGLSFRAVEVIS